MFRSIQAHGILGLAEHFFQRSKLWSLALEQVQEAGNSSVSDSANYLHITKYAASDVDVLSRFRSNREYRQILEHVSRIQGFEYLKEIKVSKTILKEQVLKVDFLNTFGAPLVYFYPGLGFLSPTTLRYLKVFNELINLFPKLVEMDITEIGGGFGGQAAVLRNISGFKSYTIYDLPEVHRLQSKFLGANNSESGVFYSDGRLPSAGVFDLIISNYALSELQPDLQIAYFENVVKSSLRGYVTWNLISENRLGGLTVEEVLGYIPNARVTEESPLTDEGNVLITWGTT